ncbi:MAG: Na+/H+ antiporter subunit C [Phycisphaerales bacterium]
MQLLLAIVIGLLYAAGLYMMLRRSIVKLLLGLALLGHGANLLIFASPGIVRGAPPLIREGDKSMNGTVTNGDFTDPLPLALILTAIVISFAILAFTSVLVKRAYQEVGTDDLDDMKATDT